MTAPHDDGGREGRVRRRDVCPHCGAPLARFIDFGLHEQVMCTAIGCFYLSTAAQHDLASALADLRDAMLDAFYIPQIVEWLARRLPR